MISAPGGGGVDFPSCPLSAASSLGVPACSSSVRLGEASPPPPYPSRCSFPFLLPRAKSRSTVAASPFGVAGGGEGGELVPCSLLPTAPLTVTSSGPGVSAVF
ncbi:unnamed protein product, partial [Ectocarpus sp. 12 AP-2014]